MASMFIKHRVADYAKWKTIFDEDGVNRKAGGSKGSQLFRNADNPNEVIVLLEWDDLGKARQFTQSPKLREAMEPAGVTDQPDIYFLDEVERGAQ